MNIKKALSEYMVSLGLRLEGPAADKILRFLDIVYIENNRFNLVGTTEKEKIFTRHFLDCLSIYNYLIGICKQNSNRLRIIDVGTGAGLPGILIGIINKEAVLTLLDSRAKITRFLGRVVDELAIDNVSVVCGRAEILSHQNSYREMFDIVVARAVSRINILCELMVPFCKIGGKAIMYKSRKLEDELPEAERAITVMGAEVEGIFEIDVPYLEEYRALLVLNKSRQTEYKYPRKYARIIKMPIV